MPSFQPKKTEIYEPKSNQVGNPLSMDCSFGRPLVVAAKQEEYAEHGRRPLSNSDFWNFLSPVNISPNFRIVGIVLRKLRGVETRFEAQKVACRGRD